MHAVVHVRVELKGWSQQKLIAHASVHHELLVLHIVVSQPGELASLPGEVTHVEGVMERTEEEESVHDDGPLVDVPQLGGVGCIYHN